MEMKKVAKKGPAKDFMKKTDNLVNAYKFDG